MTTLPIVKPHFPKLTNFADRLDECLASGRVTNGGQYVERFERELTEYLDVPTIVFSSGQVSLITMLMAAGVRADKEVVCPSFTFCGTPHAIAMLGAKPVFADIDPDTLTLDPLDVYRKITPNTTAILAVDVYGICSDYAALQNIANEFHIQFLVDSAPAFGSHVGGKPTGGNADAQIFSFHATKVFSSLEGGALCSKNIEFIKRARIIRDFGQTNRRECVLVGLNGKMTEVCALVGLENLKGWPERVAQRYRSAAVLRHKLRGIEGLRAVEEPESQQPIWCYLPVLVQPEFWRPRNVVFDALHARGVMARKYYPACHQTEPYFRASAGLPVTESIAYQVVALPVYDDMSGEEMDYIVKAFWEAKL